LSAVDKDFLASLPTLPGVYRMIDDAGAVLYVGKAKDLKKRVSSYFQKTDQSPRIRLMLKSVDHIDTTVTRTEAEALLLENNLIKGLKPRFNILFRDDKSYPYVALTGHAFPRLAYFRGTPDKRGHFFGPFPSATAVKESIHLLQKIFRLRTCEDTVFAHRTRPCLLHQIARCSAPCVGLASAGAYAADVNDAVLFLQGKEHELIERLTAAMETAAGALEFERAALYRDQLRSLSKVRERQAMDRQDTGADADIVALASEQGLTCVALAMVRAGRHLGDRTFFPEHARDAQRAEVLEAFLAQHYAQHAPPRRIIVSDAPESEELVAMLAARAGHAVDLIAHPTGERRVWLELAAANARLALQRRANETASHAARQEALREALDLPQLARIECFDISHTRGEAAVASCVVYDRGDMRSSEYRRFNVAPNAPGDDYAAMREALARRYRRVMAGQASDPEHWPMPDLVLIDGGKGQLHVAMDVFAELGLSEVALLGVAKGEARKPGEEQLVRPDGTVLRLPATHPGLHLIQQVRDEAHRFAITGHRARRAKARGRSALEDIAGVGPRRRQRLLAEFGGLKGLSNASVEDLMRVEGISRGLAERIYRELH
jgi:excinuclease ABC subunit C